MEAYSSIKLNIHQSIGKEAKEAQYPKKHMANTGLTLVILGSKEDYKY